MVSRIRRGRRRRPLRNDAVSALLVLAVDSRRNTEHRQSAAVGDKTRPENRRGRRGRVVNVLLLRSLRRRRRRGGGGHRRQIIPSPNQRRGKTGLKGSPLIMAKRRRCSTGRALP